jgi:DNA-directed RNA polymerase subunit RPC12/RpoP
MGIEVYQVRCSRTEDSVFLKMDKDTGRLVEIRCPHYNYRANVKHRESVPLDVRHDLNFRTCGIDLRKETSPIGFYQDCLQDGLEFVELVKT